MRILLLNQFYRPDVAATGQLLADLAEELVRRGHDVHVVCSRRAYGGGERSHPPLEVVSGVHVHRVRATGFGRRHTVGRVLDYLSFYVLAAYHSLKLRRVDVCVALTTPPFIGLVGAILWLLHGTRLVLWSMDLYPEVAVAFGLMRSGSMAHRLLSRLSRLLYAKASGIVSLGEVMAQRLIEAGAARQRVTTSHNWVPAESVHPIPADRSALRRAWRLDGRPVLMYSGNLGLGHDLDTVLRAVARLRDATDLRLVLVGDGKRRRPLEDLSARLGLACVEFHDPVPLGSLADSLAAGDIHIVSQKEGTQGLIVPSKTYGVLAAGRPILFVGPGGCEVERILAASKAGIVVAPGSVEGVVVAVATLLRDPKLRDEMGRRARSHYERHFGREHSLPRIVEVIESAGADVAGRPEGETALG